MPVYLFPANITIDKAAVAENFTGGTDDFRHAFFTGAEAHNQEDNELFSISSMNVDEFDLELFTDNGLYYDEANQYSDDFTVYVRYTGLLWDVDWIRYNGVFAWHAQCKTEELEAIRKISDLTVDEIVQMQERGVNPLTTIRL